MGKKKSFIDRKHATTFKLVHRSQRDPLIANDEIGQHVLQPIASKDFEKRTKYGIYYTDDYDYLKHLKSVGETIDLGEVERTIIPASNPTRNLPSVIFETKGVELKVGLLNQAAPTNELLPDIDPDIAAALDGEFEDEEIDEFEDDFILKLNADGEAGEFLAETNQMKDEYSGKSELMRRFGLIREKKFSDNSSGDEDINCDNDDDDGLKMSNDAAGDKEERRTRFTNYSMSSAVIKRPNGLQIIDEHFESLYEQYDDEKLGQIDDETEFIGGHIEPNDERFQQLVKDYASHKHKFIPEKPTEEMKDLALKYAANENDETNTESGSESEDEAQRRKRRWDCESILSTYSNKKNHPLVIKEERPIFKRQRRENDTKVLLNEMDEEIDDTQSICTTTTNTARPRGETTEERRARKTLVREERRARRVEKKINKSAFKDQKKEFERQKSTVQVKTRPIR